jgi:aldehyde:ferredoxin oxidoreductase
MESIERLKGCPYCVIPCRQEGKIRGGEYDSEIIRGSLYGKSATSGQLLDVEDYRLMLHMVGVANRNGIDFYTATRLIDFVTRSATEGKLSSELIEKDKLERNYECYLNLLNEIIEKRGIGSILSDGWYGVETKLGLNPQDYWYAGIVKGVDFIYDPRAGTFHPLMMSFITNPRPHHGGYHTLTTSPGHSIREIKEQVMHWGLPEETIERIFTPSEYSGEFNVGIYTKYNEDAMCVRNSLGACSIYSFFGLINIGDLAEYYSTVTGLETSASDLLKAGERIFNLKKLINMREGFTQRDEIPELWLRPMESPEGVIRIKDYFKTVDITKESFEKILDDYYKERGWNIVTGTPTKEKLNELGLGKFHDKE